MSFYVLNFAEFRLVSVVVNVMGDVFPELKQQAEHIVKVIEEEEESFGRTLIKVRMVICMQASLRIITYQLHDSHPSI